MIQRRYLSAMANGEIAIKITHGNNIIASNTQPIVPMMFPIDSITSISTPFNLDSIQKASTEATDFQNDCLS